MKFENSINYIFVVYIYFFWLGTKLCVSIDKSLVAVICLWDGETLKRTEGSLLGQCV